MDGKKEVTAPGATVGAVAERSPSKDNLILSHRTNQGKANIPDKEDLLERTMTKANTYGFRVLPSYYEAIRDLPDAERLRIYDAIMDYGFGNEVGELPPLLNGYFGLIKPSLEGSIKFEAKQVANGKRAGDRQNPAETQAKPKQNPPETLTLPLTLPMTMPLPLTMRVPLTRTSLSRTLMGNMAGSSSQMRSMQSGLPILERQRPCAASATSTRAPNPQATRIAGRTGILLSAAVIGRAGACVPIIKSRRPPRRT